jgi:hypothetical protein
VSPRLALWSCALALAFAPARSQSNATAPDGQRGLGAQTPLADLLSLARSTRDDDRRFLADLHALGTEIRILVATTAERYRQRGYLQLLDSSEPQTLDALHAAFHTLELDPLARLARDDAFAQVLARALLDVRFRARVGVLEGWEFETQEIERGLGVLRAATDGYVVLIQEEASNIAARVDLSATLLRAMRNDLQVLRASEPEPPDRAGEAATAELLRVARDTEGEGVRRAAIERMVSAARVEAAKIESVLFTPRVAHQVAALLEWRSRIFQESESLRRDALSWLPDTVEGRAATEDFTRIAKDERIRRAAAVARQGLAIDPLDDVLAWVAGHALDFHWGVPESRPWFDRFLALHGIRAHDHRTYQSRELDRREREALDVVQRPILPGRVQPAGY